MAKAKAIAKKQETEALKKAAKAKKAQAKVCGAAPGTLALQDVSARAGLRPGATSAPLMACMHAARALPAP